MAKSSGNCKGMSKRIQQTRGAVTEQRRQSSQTRDRHRTELS